MKTSYYLFATFVYLLSILLGFSFSELLSKNGDGSYKKELVKPDGYITANQYRIDVLHYQLKFDLDTENKILTGESEIRLILTAHTDTIDLNLHDNLKVSELYVNGRAALYLQKNKRLGIVIRDAGLNEGDTAMISIRYQGTPKREGFAAFSFGKINGNSLVYTLSEPVYASNWFPCNDRPDDKAFADVIIGNDSSQISVSLGRLINVETKGNKRYYHWKSAYPVSTYLISIYSSGYSKISDQYISVTGDTIPLEYYVLPNQVEKAKIDFSEHNRMLEVFEKLFGPYPFPEDKYGVAVFLWQMGAMENQTITGVGSNFITGTRSHSSLLAHELAHHWWGNSVSPREWKDIWLNEGFASYSEALYAEQTDGRAALIADMANRYSQFFIEKLYNPQDKFSSTVYEKGAYVLHMLRRETGDTNFFEIIKKYHEKFIYSNASVSDFIILAQEISGMNLGQFFEQWVFRGTGGIICDYTWKNDLTDSGRKLAVHLTQVQKGYPGYIFPLDLKITYGDGSTEIITRKITSNDQILEIDVKMPVKSIEPDPEKWLFGEFRLKK
ncbi:MAG: M1 family metallopeptidase [Ignavibacteriaceae bacterium]|nr:M1 family metallopeptidase [Ignavibacteriaceae bacterium]NUM71438.1 M1 family metallopeptidase [Ignavibacteriaceae bacterium]